MKKLNCGCVGKCNNEKNNEKILVSNGSFFYEKECCPCDVDIENYNPCLNTIYDKFTFGSGMKMKIKKFLEEKDKNRINLVDVPGMCYHNYKFLEEKNITSFEKFLEETCLSDSGLCNFERKEKYLSFVKENFVCKKDIIFTTVLDWLYLNLQNTHLFILI